ncbi:MAG TPA: CHAP domain-containing protein [Myxococcus sp.]|jgi:hypothetical protein|nr:CHAP domain-containing protein [Myxococcus sp.]
MKLAASGAAIASIQPAPSQEASLLAPAELRKMPLTVPAPESPDVETRSWFTPKEVAPMLRFPTKLLSLSLLTLSLAAVGCGGNAPAQESSPEAPAQPEAATPSEHDGHAHDAEGGEVSAMSFDGPCAWACNDQCTTYARCRAPNLPTGLYTWQDKLNIINSNHAHVSCVAVIDSSNPAGHVAYVHRVETAPTPNRIYIHEANWVSGQCSARDGSKDALDIRGYWCPRGVHTSNCPGPI